jgi:hypothetical protein
VRQLTALQLMRGYRQVEPVDELDGLEEQLAA